MALGQLFGNALDIVGTGLHLPEMGLSERLAGGRTVFTANNPSYQAQSYAPTSGPMSTEVMSRNTSVAPAPRPTNTSGGGSPSYNTTGTVLGEQSFNDYAAGAPMNEGGGEPSIDWNAVYAPAFGALDQYQATLQPGYETNVKELETTAGQRKGDLQAAQQKQLGTVNTQRTREQNRTQSAIAEARRLAAEMQQGIQAKFGGSTNAGGAYSEILGSQASRNIANNQAAGQEAAAALDQQENEINSEFQRQNKNLDDDLVLQKERAKNQLQQELASIAAERGKLESEKANRRLEAVQSYQQYLRDADARNVAFKQQLFQGWQQRQQEIENFKNQQRSQVTASLRGADFGNYLGGSPYTTSSTNNIRSLQQQPDDEIIDRWLELG